MGRMAATSNEGTSKSARGGADSDREVRRDLLGRGWESKRRLGAFSSSAAAPGLGTPMPMSYHRATAPLTRGASMPFSWLGAHQHVEEDYGADRDRAG